MTRLVLALDFYRTVRSRLVLRLSAGKGIKNIIKISGFLILLFLIYVNIFRFLNFAFNIAGLDDSGWYFGMAENLAFRGKYASFTNPSLGVDKSAVATDIFNRISTVGQDDLDYFPVGVSVGPGLIVPVAIFLKIFGVGYWQFRLFPIISYFFLLGTMLWVVYRLSGIGGMVVLAILLNLFPHLAIPLGFEAFGEPTGFLYVLLGGIFLAIFLKKECQNLLFLVFSGMFFSLATLTKTLYFLNFLPALLIYFLYLQKKKQSWRKFFLLLFSFLLPILLFEIYRFIVLFGLGGLSTYIASLSSGLVFFFTAGGSPLGGQPFVQKMAVFKEIGFSQPFYVILCFFCFVAFFIKKWQEQKDSLFLLIFTFWLTNLTWFFIFSNTGWARHFWPGLLLTLIFLSSFLSDSFSQIKKGKFLFPVLATFLLISFSGQINFSFIFRPKLEGGILLDWRNKFMEKGFFGARLPLPIFPLSAQKPAVNFIRENVPLQSRIYYVGGLLVSEIPPLAKRIFYSTERIPNEKMNQLPAYVVFGPYQVSSWWRIVSLEEYARELTKYCGWEVFGNDYYKICLLR